MGKQLVPTEHAEQVTFVQWFRREYPDVLIFAIPNGEFRHKATGVRLKAEGVEKGIPDLYIPEWDLWIEMKRQKGGRLSPEQKEKLEYLESIGHSTYVAKGAQSAIEFIKTFKKC